MPKSRSELETYLKTVLHQLAPEASLDRLDPVKNLRRQLRIDSLDFLNLVLIVHQDTGLDVPETDYRRLFTWNGMLEYFEGKI